MDLTALRTRLGVAADMPDDEVLSLAVTRLPGGDTPAPPDPVTPTTTQTPAPVAVTPETKIAPQATNTVTPAAETKPVEDKAPETPAAEPAKFVVPEGMALVDASMLNEMKQVHAANSSFIAAAAKREEDEFIGRVVASGRLHPSEDQSPQVHKMLRAAYRRDKEEAATIAASMSVLFPTQEMGYAGTGEVNASAANEVWTAQDAQIFPELLEVRNNGKG